MAAFRSLNELLRRPTTVSSLFQPWYLKKVRPLHWLPGLRLKSKGLRSDWGIEGHSFSTLPFKGRGGINRAQHASKRPASAVNGAYDMVVPEDDEEDPQKTKLMNSVIRVYCKHTEPNFSLPWQRKRQMASSSSGFLVSQGRDKLVLTNAHSVAYYSQVQVKRRDDDRKFIAKVLAIGTDCDIALLTVEEKDFWEGIDSLTLGPLPRLQDYVTVVGYPIGGDSISVTSGVVSRIEMTQYSHGGCELLAAQIDAAINSGNSGGPVFNESGECVGIAFQSYADSDVENIGYMIPTPVIRHFLQDYHMNRAFTGFANLGLSWQKLEAPDLRSALGMDGTKSGVLVRTVYPTSTSHGILLPGDVLMKFDSTRIANDGTVPFRKGERIMYNYLISQKFVGDVAQLEVLRNGQWKKLQVELQRFERLVPAHLDNGEPSFFVLAGMVFTILNEHYLLSEYGGSYTTDAPVKLLHEMCYGVKEHKDQEVVVLSQVLASDATVGFEDVCNSMVHEFNGTQVRSLNHLVELVVTCQQEYMRFDLDYDQVIVLNSELAKRTTPEILEEHCIPDMASEDVMDHLERSGLVKHQPKSKAYR